MKRALLVLLLLAGCASEEEALETENDSIVERLDGHDVAAGKVTLSELFRSACGASRVHVRGLGRWSDAIEVEPRIQAGWRASKVLSETSGDLPDRLRWGWGIWNGAVHVFPVTSGEPSRTDSDMALELLADGRTVQARGRDGRILWKSDVGARETDPGEGSMIRYLTFRPDVYVDVSFAKHSTAAINLETGFVTFGGSD